MKALINEKRYIIYTLMLGIYLVNIFLDHNVLLYMAGIIAIPVFIISFAAASRLFKILGTFFIGAGVILFVVSGESAAQIPIFLTSNMQLLAFLAVLPWMNSVVHAGRFDRKISQLLRADVDDLGKLYARSSITSYLLVCFINLSALPFSQQVLQDNLSAVSKKLRESFVSRTTLRAFAIALAWSPMEIMVAITIDATGVGYAAYLPWLLLCSLLVLAIEMLWGRIEFRKHPYTPANQKMKNESINWKTLIFKIIELFAALSVFLMAVLLIGNWTGFNFILTVTLVLIPFSMCWAFVIQRWHTFRIVGWSMWKQRTTNMQNFVVLFLALGLFSSSLNETPVLTLMQTPFEAASGFPLAILLLIQFTYLGLSMVGVHPIATIGILMEILPPLYETMNPLSIGIVLITGGLATATVGTFGITVTMTAQNTMQNPYKITYRNMPFALLYGGMGTLIAYLLL